jgi:uncharacterized OB-fold protein
VTAGVPDLSAYQPHPDGLTEPFWVGAGQGRLVLSRCPQCRRWQHPPLDLCRFCAVHLVPELAPMHGTIYSYTVTYHDSIPLYRPPFAVAVVEIGDEGEPPRIVARVADSDPGELSVGAPVRIETRPLPGGPYAVPVAVLDRGAAA